MVKQSEWPRKLDETTREYLEKLIAYAFQEHFTDLYFLPKQKSYELSGQQRGSFQQILTLELGEAQALLSLIKYWAQLDLAELRRPQLGRFDFKNGFVRVSSVGDFLGRESIVLRLIQRQLQTLSFSDVKMWKKLVAERPQSGLYLLVGPTGSGKTTTLYALLKEWSFNLAILTVEDPVEIEQPAFLQLQVNETAGVSYQDLIKVALRHRPDILVIGEIRDGKTAQAALQASLSGHLVMATIHANSAELVVERLVDLGLDRALVLEAIVKSVYLQLKKGDSGQLQAQFNVVDWQRGSAHSNDKGEKV